MQLRRSIQDWLLEAIAFAALVAMFAMVFGHWQRLPVFARRGSGGSYSVMVLLNAGIYLLLTFASRYQQLVSVPFEIDRDRPEVKQLLLQMTIVLKTILMVLLAGLLWIIVHTPFGPDADRGTRIPAGIPDRDARTYAGLRSQAEPIPQMRERR